jgi:hypothetical protein
VCWEAARYLGLIVGIPLVLCVGRRLSGLHTWQTIGLCVGRLLPGPHTWHTIGDVCWEAARYLSWKAWAFRLSIFLGMCDGRGQPGPHTRILARHFTVFLCWETATWASNSAYYRVSEGGYLDPIPLI